MYGRTKYSGPRTMLIGGSSDIPSIGGHVSQSRYCEIPRMLNPRRTGFERLPLFSGPRSGLRGAVCMSGPSSGTIGWGGTLAAFRTQSPHATIWIVRGAGIGDHPKRMDLGAPLSTLKDLVSANGSVGSLSGYTTLSRFGHFSTARLVRPTAARHARPVSVWQGV